MLSGWNVFAGWRVLEFFLEHSTETIHVKELSRRLKISPQTASTYLNALADDGILEKKASANALFFSLKQRSPLVLTLKKAFALSTLSKKKLVEKILKENPATTSIVLYGSRASGEYSPESDFDILLFSKDKKIPKKAIEFLGDKLTLNIMTLDEWRATSPEFRSTVKKNHVTLYGPELIDNA